MAKFVAAVIRTVHQTMEIEVEADDVDDAFVKAEEEAGNHDFSGLEKSAEYEVSRVRSQPSRAQG